jgi:hypothetical protein
MSAPFSSGRRFLGWNFLSNKIRDVCSLSNIVSIMFRTGEIAVNSPRLNLRIFAVSPPTSEISGRIAFGIGAIVLDNLIVTIGYVVEVVVSVKNHIGYSNQDTFWVQFDGDKFMG